MIVVTAPTGQIGSKVVKSLLAAQQRVRVISRHPEQLPPEVRSSVEVIEGSHSDAQVVDRAFEGASTVFWLVASDPRAVSAKATYVDFSKPGCEAMKKYGIKNVVGISALGRGWPKDTGLVSGTLALDDLIASTGVAYRALCCGSLMENTLRQAQLIKDQGVFYGVGPGDLKGSAVAIKDVARVASDLLLNTHWKGFEEVDLAGPAEISNDEMAAEISKVVGKPVRFQEMTLGDFQKMLLGRGNTVGMAQAMMNMMIAKIAGLDSLKVATTPKLTPTTFQQWAQENFSARVAI